MNDNAVPRPENTSFTFDDVCLAPGEQIGLHEQATWELSYIIVGSGMRLIGDRTEPFGSGEVVIVPPEIPHCWYFENDVTDAQGHIANITITFGREFLDNCCVAFPELQECTEKLKRKRDAVKFGKEKSSAIASVLEEMRPLGRAERIPLMIKLLLILAGSEEESVVGQYQKMDPERERMNRIQVYVVCNAKRDITLDDVARTVTVDGEPVELTFKEYSLLHFFLEHPEEVLARERIMKAVWDTDDLLESRTIDMHVRTLRQKLAHAGDAICTVRKVGYKLSAKGTEAGEDA